MIKEINTITGISEIVDRYDALVIDLWGVIHNGVNLLPGVMDCLKALRAKGLPYAFLTNAPRRAEHLIGAMVEMGLPSDFAPIVISSGEETWLALKKRNDPWFRGVGDSFYHIGPGRDKGLFDGLSFELSSSPSDADLIINTGPWGPMETVMDYEPILCDGIRSGVKMVCANPDLEVIRGVNRVICAGALAARYEELGGKVKYFGKPRRSIYESCLQRLGYPDKKRVLAIGDSLNTDIAGAAEIGIDSLLVLSGVHAEELSGKNTSEAKSRLFQKCKESGNFPNNTIVTFCW